MKKLFLFLAVSGLIFVSCGKKAEPTPTPAPAPQETVAPAPTPAPEPAPAATSAPEKKTTPTKEVKKVEEPTTGRTPATVSKAQEKTQTAVSKPVQRSLEEKLKHLNEYSPEEQKAILKEAQEKGISVGTSTKTKKGTK